MDFVGMLEFRVWERLIFHWSNVEEVLNQMCSAVEHELENQESMDSVGMLEFRL